MKYKSLLVSNLYLMRHSFGEVFKVIIILNYDLNKAKSSKMILVTYCLMVLLTNAKLHVDASGNHIVSTLIMLIICSKFFRISPTEFKT